MLVSVATKESCLAKTAAKKAKHPFRGQAGSTSHEVICFLISNTYGKGIKHTVTICICQKVQFSEIVVKRVYFVLCRSLTEAQQSFLFCTFACAKFYISIFFLQT